MRFSSVAANFCGVEALKRERAQGGKADCEEKPPSVVRFLTVVAGTSHVLDQQRPRPGGVLIPGVGGHESPVVETF